VKVLHMLTRMPASGTERQLAGVLRAALVNELWDPTLCVLHAGYPLARELAGDGIELVEIDASGALAWPTRAGRLHSEIRHGSYDVVHSSLWGANVLSRLASVRPRRPGVVLSERRVEDFRSAPRRSLDAALRPLADEYIGNSTEVVAFIQRAHHVPPERVHLVENGVDTSVFFAAPRTERHIRALGSVGRLIPQKGFDILIAALPQVLTERKLHVRIAGSGRERERLERMACGLPVEFVGELSTPEAVAEHLRSLDLFVLPSRYEGRPNVVLEARACGLPVVATEVEGTRDLQSLGGLRFVPPDDSAALAQALLAALDDPSPPPPAQIPTFASVARQHRAVFELAAHGRHQAA
jgi:glycosyltransferase involved in cell wall biosynthesis